MEQSIAEKTFRNTISVNSITIVQYEVWPVLGICKKSFVSHSQCCAVRKISMSHCSSIELMKITKHLTSSHSVMRIETIKSHIQLLFWITGRRDKRPYFDSNEYHRSQNGPELLYLEGLYNNQAIMLPKMNWYLLFFRETHHVWESVRWRQECSEGYASKGNSWNCWCSAQQQLEH